MPNDPLGDTSLCSSLESVWPSPEEDGSRSSGQSLDTSGFRVMRHAHTIATLTSTTFQWVMLIESHDGSVVVAKTYLRYMVRIRETAQALMEASACSFSLGGNGG